MPNWWQWPTAEWFRLPRAWILPAHMRLGRPHPRAAATELRASLDRVAAKVAAYADAERIIVETLTPRTPPAAGPYRRPAEWFHRDDVLRLTKARPKGNVPHWQAEARVFRSQARRRFVPSMRQRLDLAGIYSDALRGLPDTIDGTPPLPVPGTCPATLDELPAEE